MTQPKEAQLMFPRVQEMQRMVLKVPDHLEKNDLAKRRKRVKDRIKIASLARSRRIMICVGKWLMDRFVNLGKSTFIFLLLIHVCVWLIKVSIDYLRS
jgi:hypothetical protein